MDKAKHTPSLAVKYAVRRAAGAQDRATILGLWQQAFPMPAQHPIKYDWCYAPTPWGEGRLYVLEIGDEAAIIGVQGIVSRRWWVNGEPRAAGICADLVVEKTHRSIGPALALVRGVVEVEQARPDAMLLYGFPNPKSEALYRRAGYHKMGEITRYARPLRLRVWLQRKGMPGPLAHVAGKLLDVVLQTRVALRARLASRQWQCLPATQFDQRFDALWSRVAVNVGPMVMRNSEYLRWRFGNNFAGQTQVLVLQRKDAGIDGYVVYMVTVDKMVYILDFLAVEPLQALPAMLMMFERAMYQQGHHGITLEFSGPESIADVILSSGFSARETNPIYAVMSGADSGSVQNSVVYFTSSDRDQ